MSSTSRRAMAAARSSAGKESTRTRTHGTVADPSTTGAPRTDGEGAARESCTLSTAVAGVCGERLRREEPEDQHERPPHALDQG